MERDQKAIADLNLRIAAAKYTWYDFVESGCKRQADYWRNRTTDLSTDLAFIKGYLVKR